MQALKRVEVLELGLGAQLGLTAAAQRYVAVVVHLYGRYVVEHFGCRLSGVAYELRHVERLAVYLELHSRALSGDGDALQHLCILRHIYNIVVLVGVRGVYLELACLAFVAHEGQLQRVSVVGESLYLEVAVGVAHTAAHKLAVGSLRNLHVHKTKWFGVAFIQNLSFYQTLRPSRRCAEDEHYE